MTETKTATTARPYRNEPAWHAAHAASVGAMGY